MTIESTNFDFFANLKAGWKALFMVFWAGVMGLIGYFVAVFFSVKWYSVVIFFVLAVIFLLGLGWISRKIGIMK